MKTKRKNRRKNRKSRNKKQKGGYLDKVSCLTHQTSIAYLQSILKEGYIIARPGDPPMKILGVNGAPDRYEILNKGAFFSLVLKQNENMSIYNNPRIPSCTNEVTLIFSKKLLEDYPYHITNNWVGGMKFSPLTQVFYSGHSGNVHSYSNVNDYINANIGKDTLKNEVVFNENIPLDYLIEIWVCNIERMNLSVRTKNPDGTFSRNQEIIKFNPENVKKEVEKMLSESNYNRVQVKRID